MATLFKRGILWPIKPRRRKFGRYVTEILYDRGLTRRERDRMLSNDARARRTELRLWQIYPRMAAEAYVHSPNLKASR